MDKHETPNASNVLQTSKKSLQTKTTPPNMPSCKSWAAQSLQKKHVNSTSVPPPLNQPLLASKTSKSLHDAHEALQLWKNPQIDPSFLGKWNSTCAVT